MLPISGAHGEELQAAHGRGGEGGSPSGWWSTQVVDRVALEKIEVGNAFPITQTNLEKSPRQGQPRFILLSREIGHGQGAHSLHLCYES